MAATIKIKNSSTAGAAPTASDLVQGELAVNVTDKRLYTENSGGTIVELGTNPSVPVTFPDGSASAPSLTNSGDTNTGMFFPAADTIAFAEGGTETMRLDSSGNMGLGVTPSAWSAVKAMQIGTAAVYAPTSSQNTTLSANNYYDGSVFKYMTSDYASYYQQFSGQHRWYNAASGTAGNTITFTQAMTLDASGNLGIGTTSPSSQLQIYPSTANVFTEGLRVNRQGQTGQYTIINYASGIGRVVAVDSLFNSPSLGFFTSSDGSTQTERARIDSSGNLLVGTTTSFGTNTKIFLNSSANGTISNPHFAIGGAASNYNIIMWLDGTAAYIGQNSDARSLRLFSGSTGTSGVNLAAGGTSWGTYSDERIKTDLNPIQNAVYKVSTLRSVTGRYKTDDADVSRAFLIAQDVQAVLPEAVDVGTDEDETLFLKYTEVIPLLVAAIKELKAEIDVLKGQA